MDVAPARLVEVVAPRRCHVGDRARHGHGDAQHRTGRVRRATAEAHQHAGTTGPHQVQRCLVRRAAADDDRHVELVDELLEVQRLRVAGHVLGRHRRAPDDEQVDTGVDHGLVELRRALRGQRGGRRHTCVADLADALPDEVVADRCGVHLLHPARDLLVRQLGELGEQRLGVVVPCPEALEVEYAEAAEAAHRDRGRR